LPEAVKNSFDKTAYTSWYIDEMKQIESPGKNLFVIQVHHSYAPDGAIPGSFDDVCKLYFDANGSLLNKEHKE